MSTRRIIGTTGLLATWEAGLTAGSGTRALLLHSAARPETGVDDLLSVPVGSRDADLYDLRGALFGDRLEVRLACRECAEEMEFAIGVRDVVGAAPRPEAAADPLVVAVDDWSVRFRLPTPGDLAAVETVPPERAGTALIARCVLDAARDGTPVPAEELPEPVRRRIAETATAADPCADVTLNLACPACGHQATAELDIASYLWIELDAWARGTLLDVHLLATAYGWNESEILALSPLRRRYYLELCADG